MSQSPRIRRVGLAGLLISFGSEMSEPANRAALAFRAALDAEYWPEVSETMMSLVSVFVARITATMTVEAIQNSVASINDLQGDHRTYVQAYVESLFALGLSLEEVSRAEIGSRSLLHRRCLGWRRLGAR